MTTEEIAGYWVLGFLVTLFVDGVVMRREEEDLGAVLKLFALWPLMWIGMAILIPGHLAHKVGGALGVVFLGEADDEG